MKRWNIATVKGKTLLEKIINSRDIKPEFFKDNKLHNPYLLKDMDIAVELIKRHINADNKIIVYGDYDVDGVTSTTILTDYFRQAGANVSYFVPNRHTDGYGLNKLAIKNLIDEGAKLIITVDNGIRAIDETLFAIEQGIDIIITDHHEPGDTVPQANAIINPKQKDCAYPFKELAGVGVVFKLICALSLDAKKVLETYADFIAIGTIADVMKLIGENRALVSKGLEVIRCTKNNGLAQLIADANIKKVTAGNIGYHIAPRINAGGRLDSALIAAKLFLDDKLENSKILCEYNDKRRVIEKTITDEIIERIQDSGKIDDIIIMAGENWEPGVIGIVASRIASKYYKPVILICTKDGTGTASGRSIAGFDLFKYASECSHFCEKFGGHSMALGLTIKSQNIEKFRENMLKICDTRNCKQTIDIDAIIDDKLTIEDVKSLSVLEPFGNGNRQPNLAFISAEILGKKSISSGAHQKLTIEFNHKNYDVMLFGASDTPFVLGDIVDIAFTVDINIFNGRESLSLVCIDIRHNFDIYNKFINGDTLSEAEKIILKPTYEELVYVFRQIKLLNENAYKHIGINMQKFKICLDIFLEFNLISNKNDKIDILHTDEKVDIRSAVILKKLSIDGAKI